MMLGAVRPPATDQLYASREDYLRVRTAVRREWMCREGRQQKLTWPSTSPINRLLEMVTRCV